MKKVKKISALSTINPRENVYLFGVNQNNLKNVDVIFPKYKFIVVTGVSGSGKSSLVVDTLYAEGHRKYVESLSTYVRQFVARVAKPKVKKTLGLAPALLLEQRKATSKKHSIVAGITEIYDFLRVFFASVGKTYSPLTGKEIKCDNTHSVLEHIKRLDPGKKAYIAVKFANFHSPKAVRENLEKLLLQGYSRVLIGNDVMHIEDVLENQYYEGLQEVVPVIYRFKTKREYSVEELNVLADAIETAFHEGHGKMFLIVEEEPEEEFSDSFEEAGISYQKPVPAFFNNKSPLGACPSCKGTGISYGPVEELIIPDPLRSLEGGAVEIFNVHPELFETFLKDAASVGIRTDVPYLELSEQEKYLLWYGSGEKLIGVLPFFQDGLARSYHVPSYRYYGKGRCLECKGSGIRREALYVKINGKDIADILAMTIEDAYDWFVKLQFSEHEKKLSETVLNEIRTRLKYLKDVGVNYLNLNRKISTLSGGELQRVKLAGILGSPLVGTLYILDEPTIGLHSRDTDRLIKILKQLRDKGNTVIVIEHDELVIRSADYVIDVGPRAGEHGGEIVFAGTQEEFAVSNTETALFIRQQGKISAERKQRKPKGWIALKGAWKHNIKNLDVRFPLGVICSVAGVSGSGKSTLIEILREAISRKIFDEYHIEQPPKKHFKKISFPEKYLTEVIFVDQNTLSRSSRSTPATYIGAFDYIRELFASLPEAASEGFTAGYFSFNSPGGRCETCQGEGYITIEMQFLPDIKLLCHECQGKRYQPEILNITYKGHSIYDVLNLTVSEAVKLFGEDKKNKYTKKIAKTLGILEEVGMGYIKLGQSTSTLSGGEAQRLKLASFLHETLHPTLFIFDEPTTGLHFQDVEILLKAFNKLIDKGHSVIIIEHNLDVLANSDYIIELGPDSGSQGGEIVFAGTPRQLIRKRKTSSQTAKFLAGKL